MYPTFRKAVHATLVCMALHVEHIPSRCSRCASHDLEDIPVASTLVASTFVSVRRTQGCTVIPWTLHFTASEPPAGSAGHHRTAQHESWPCCDHQFSFTASTRAVLSQNSRCVLEGVLVCDQAETGQSASAHSNAGLCALFDPLLSREHACTRLCRILPHCADDATQLFQSSPWCPGKRRSAGLQNPKGASRRVWVLTQSTTARNVLKR